MPPLAFPPGDPPHARGRRWHPRWEWDCDGGIGEPAWEARLWGAAGGGRGRAERAAAPPPRPPPAPTQPWEAVIHAAAVGAAAAGFEATARIRAAAASAWGERYSAGALDTSVAAGRDDEAAFQAVCSPAAAESEQPVWGTGCGVPLGVVAAPREAADAAAPLAAPPTRRRVDGDGRWYHAASPPLPRPGSAAPRPGSSAGTRPRASRVVVAARRAGCAGVGSSRRAPTLHAMLAPELVGRGGGSTRCGPDDGRRGVRQPLPQPLAQSQPQHRPTPVTLHCWYGGEGVKKKW